jgi:mannose-6-phosphate isomerase-like protein (cupin superfamily)
MSFLLTPRSGEVIADYPTVRCVMEEWPPGREGPVQTYPEADVIYFFLSGEGKFSVPLAREEKEHSFAARALAYVPPGTAHGLENRGTAPLRFVRAVAPNSPASAAPSGGAAQEPVLVLPVPSEEGIPRTDKQRGGILVFKPDFECEYHSHDGADEVFFFYSGEGEVTVEGQVMRVGPGDVVLAPAEHKHKIRAFGEPLAMWLIVAPNRVPSHTFYTQLPDGTWQRKPAG